MGVATPRVTENGYERILIHVSRSTVRSAGVGAARHSGVILLSITFFEIDPLVETTARRDFTFLADTKASVRVAIGDGRCLIGAEPDDRFDVLVLDAFSGDAIPTHLLTEEAISLYLRKLKSDSVLVIHISNRYADLARVLRGWRDATGQRVAMNQYVPAAREGAGSAGHPCRGAQSIAAWTHAPRADPAVGLDRGRWPERSLDRRSRGHDRRPHPENPAAMTQTANPPVPKH